MSGGGPAAAVSLAADAADFASTTRRVNALNDINRNRFQAVVTESNKAFLRFAEDLRIRTTEERAAVAAQVESIVSRSLSAKGRIAASAGRANVAGQSVADVQDELARQSSETQTGLSIGQRFRERSAERSIEAQRIQTRLRNLSALPAPIPRPDLTTAIFKAAGNAIASYNIGNSGNDPSADAGGPTGP